MSFPIIERDPVRLPTLAGHDNELWDTLIELGEIRPGDWTLIGGQMVFLHATEHGVTPPRISTDLDILVNARIVGRPISAFVADIVELGFDLDGISPDGIAHRYRRHHVTIDVLAPEGLSDRTNLTTTPPGRTLQVPGRNTGTGPLRVRPSRHLHPLRAGPTPVTARSDRRQGARRASRRRPDCAAP